MHINMYTVESLRQFDACNIPHIHETKTRDVLDFTFPNPAGAGFGQIYELKSSRGRSQSQIWENITNSNVNNKT